MMKRKFRFLSIVCAAIFAVPLAAIVANAQVTLPVEFKAQVPPGTWSGTSNCGQAAANMVIAYHEGETPDANGIMHIDEWLTRSPYRRSLNNYNSSGTRPWMLLDVFRVYADMPRSYMGTYWDIADVKEQLDNGLPVVCRVSARYLTNRGYSYTGGHYIVAIGYDDDAIICHDPGTPNGAFKRYSNSDFTRAHNTRTDQSEWVPGTVIVAVPDVINPPDPPDPTETFDVVLVEGTWEVLGELKQELLEWLEQNATKVE
jgi:hypothetical protein